MEPERFDALVLGTGQAGKPLALDLGSGAVRLNDCASVNDKGQFLYGDAAGGAVDPHTSSAGDPSGHGTFLTKS